LIGNVALVNMNGKHLEIAELGCPVVAPLVQVKDFIVMEEIAWL
jgi:hypothetical protein